MRIRIFLGFLFIFFFATSVYSLEAKDIPPAPPDEPSVRIVSCLDSDGGLNYYEQGVFNFTTIKWTERSHSFYPPKYTGQEEDYCRRSPSDQEGDCNHPETGILVEAYCNKEEVDLAKEEAELSQEYDCTSEGKVCYDGVCVNKEDLKKNPRYTEEIQGCKEDMGGMFWTRIFYWFSNFFR